MYNENARSGFTCMMTQDHSLFSIDITKVQDQVLISVLEEVLKAYNLETSRLQQDVALCYKEKVIEMQTDYEKYWVTYRYNMEDDMVLVRYREFVNE